MTDPETRAAALDPSTPLERLAALALESAELRLLVAANPATYPALLDWMHALDEPALTSAIEARPGGYRSMSDAAASAQASAEAAAAAASSASRAPLTRLGNTADRTVILIAAGIAIVVLAIVIVVCSTLIATAENDLRREFGSSLGSLSVLLIA